MYLDHCTKPIDFQGQMVKGQVHKTVFWDLLRDRARTFVDTISYTNRCIQLDEILHEHVPRQPLEPY